MRRRLPWLALLALLALHVALAAGHHATVRYTPGHAHHSGHRLVLDLRRQLQGHVPTDTRERIMLGQRHSFLGERTGSLLRPDRLVRELAGGDLRGAIRNDRDLLYWTQTPHAYLMPAMLGAALYWSPHPVVLAPQIYVAILLLSVFGIVRRSLGDRPAAPWIGVAAAAVASGYPAVFGLARTHHDSLSVGALALALVYLLLRTEGFRRLPFAAAAGAVAWLATRTGESMAMTTLVAMIVAGPFLMTLIQGVRSALTERRAAWRRALGLALVIGPSLALFEWFRLDEMMWNVQTSAADLDTHAALAPQVADTGVLAYLAYGIQLAVDQVRPVMTLWALAGALLLVRAPRGNRAAVALMIAVPLVALSWMPRKASWYLLPVVPALAMVTVLGLQGLPWARARTVATALAAACGVAALIYFHFAPLSVRERLDVERIVPGARSAVSMRTFPLVRPPGEIPIAYQNEGFQFMVALARELPPGDGPTLVGVLGEMETRIQAFRYAVELCRDDVLVVDLLNYGARRHMYTGWRTDAIDVLVVGNGRRSPGRFDTLGSFQSRGTSQGPPGPRDPPGRDLPPFVTDLLEREWVRQETRAGPIYIAGD